MCVERLLCAANTPHNSPIKLALPSFPLYRWENRGPEKLNNTARQWQSWDLYWVTWTPLSHSFFSALKGSSNRAKHTPVGELGGKEISS